MRRAAAAIPALSRRASVMATTRRWRSSSWSTATPRPRARIRGRALLEAVGRPVDYVVASHVIEHVPDLIGWLAEVREALEPGGELRLAVPDRRYTLDYRRSVSRLADVVHAWFMRARRPLPHQILD